MPMDATNLNKMIVHDIVEVQGYFIGRLCLNVL